MRTNLTQTTEDYLKSIYELTRSGQRATTNQLALYLGVTPASVSEMIKKLAESQPSLVDYQKHHGVILTQDGERIALEILRHHRLLEMYLHQVLGYGWDEVHDEADRLEHVISEEFEERIAQALGNPQRDPHGDPIPTRDFQLPLEPTRLLADLRPGARAVICRVRSDDPGLLRYLEEQGLVPQARLEALDYSPFDDNLMVQVEGRELPLVVGVKISRAIMIELIN